MRYLLNTDATRPRGGATFDPVVRVSGQLFGVYATEDDAAAEVILRDGGKFVSEIPVEDHELYLKKKEMMQRAQTSFQMPDLTATVLPRHAGPVAKADSAKLSVASQADYLKATKIK
jgi:hypothetical protein